MKTIARPTGNGYHLHEPVKAACDGRERNMRGNGFAPAEPRAINTDAVAPLFCFTPEQDTPSVLSELVEFSGVTTALLETIEAKDAYTRGHCERVARLSQRLAIAAGCDALTVDEATACGWLHDVGKIGIPDHVLGKTGPLTDDEFEIVRRHPEIGERILGCLPPVANIRAGVRAHHERWDGSGYPDGIAGEAISLLGRIVAIADAFDAMCSNRTYATPQAVPQALRKIAAGAGTQFDPYLVSCFLRLDPVVSRADFQVPLQAIPHRRTA